MEWPWCVQAAKQAAHPRGEGPAGVVGVLQALGPGCARLSSELASLADARVVEGPIAETCWCAALPPGLSRDPARLGTPLQPGGTPDHPGLARGGVLERFPGGC